jgi:hypothetical protein
MDSGRRKNRRVYHGRVVDNFNFQSLFNKERSMSYQSEHQHIRPVLDLARHLDIATNPHPSAIFEAGSGGFQVWCTSQDHPRGWDGIEMSPGAFSKPCEYVGSVLWKWDDDKIIGLQIETTAYAMAEQMPDKYCNLKEIPKGSNCRTIFNRDADIEWLKEKVTWLFETSGVALLPFEYGQTCLPDLRPFLLALYHAASDEYVVIVSPASNPRQFCRAGYRLVGTMEVGNAADFPVNVILRPNHDHLEAMIEEKPGPVIAQSKSNGRAHEDAWLEAAFEDRVSGELDIAIDIS